MDLGTRKPKTTKLLKENNIYCLLHHDTQILPMTHVLLSFLLISKHLD